MPKKASKTKVVKGNDPTKPALTRFTHVIIPPKMSKQIKPQAIFDGYKDKKSKDKKSKDKKLDK